MSHLPLISVPQLIVESGKLPLQSNLDRTLNKISPAFMLALPTSFAYVLTLYSRIYLDQDEIRPNSFEHLVGHARPLR